MPLQRRGRSSSPPMHRSSPPQISLSYRPSESVGVGVDVGVDGIGSDDLESPTHSPSGPSRRTKSVTFPAGAFNTPVKKAATSRASSLVSARLSVSSTPSSAESNSSRGSLGSLDGSPLPSLPLHYGGADRCLSPLAPPPSMRSLGAAGTPSKSKKRCGIPGFAGGAGARASFFAPLSSCGGCSRTTALAVLLFALLLGVMAGYARHGDTDLARSVADSLSVRNFPSSAAALSAENDRLREGVRKFKSRLGTLKKERDHAATVAERERVMKNNARRELERVKREKEEEGREAEEGRREAVDALRREIQDISRREVLESYGPGPHRVEFELLVPVGSDPANFQTHHMTAETAPLDLAPHSVNFFLRQVSRKLWDGTEISRSRQHILVTRPNDHETGEDRYVRHEAAGTHRMAFREHSDEYPHVKYTLGYAGRPGGPHWYINTMDNRRWHGPTPDYGDEGDPCFAKIVEGAPLVDAMAALPKDEEDRLVRPVVIKSARILKKDGEGDWTAAS